MSVLASQLATLRVTQSKQITGTIAAVRGLSVLVSDLPLPIGALVRILEARSDVAVGWGEVVGFEGEQSIVMLLSSAAGLAPGMRVVSRAGSSKAQMVLVGSTMLGRVIDGLGRPIDSKGSLRDTIARPLNVDPVSAMSRAAITEPLATGIRAIDGFLTLGRGQRIGIFSGAGVGKSTLLGLIARNTAADVNVIALIGERGREVRDFVERSLGEAGLARSVVVAATSDESPLMRLRAAMVACAVAEFFRDTGSDVLLMMDSVTRFAQAQRQVGLAVGEPPATRGYTPSVFAALPSLLERAGAIDGGGSITGVYSVLVDGDDLNEPISDAARGVLDGHIVLSRKLAARGHFPAIDVLASISRLAVDVCDEHHIEARQALIRNMAAYAEAEELINIGAYARGSNRETDVAIGMRDELNNFLRQKSDERAEYPLTCRSMIELSGVAEQIAERLAKMQNGASAKG